MPFGKGSRGDGVKALQRQLQKWIEHHKGTSTDTGLIGVFPDGSNPDGVFGENTMVALAEWQKRNLQDDPTGFADSNSLLGLGLEAELGADGALELGGS